MLIFLNFGHGGGRGWWIGPLITMLPFLLSSGLLTAPLQLLLWLFGLGTTQTYVYDPQTHSWRPQGTSDSSRRSRAGDGSTAAHTGDAAEAEDDDNDLLGPVIVAFTSMIVTAVLTVLLLRLTLAMRRAGVRPTLRRLLFQGFGGGWAAGGDGGQRPGHQQGRPPVARTRSERMERVARLMQALPLEVYRTREELDRTPVAELKRLLKKRGGECSECLEKSELVDALLAAASNSSAATCSVCCEDYESGDVLRVLHCGHRFHLECIDRWLLSSTDYSRPPACPICNAELDAPLEAAQ